MAAFAIPLIAGLGASILGNTIFGKKEQQAAPAAAPIAAPIPAAAPNPVAPPAPEPVKVMPVADDAAVQDAKRRTAAASAQKSGRLSTILSSPGDDKLGA